MAELTQLRCKECKRGYEISAIYVCDFCFAPLEPQYDYEAIRAGISRESIESGPATIWRYRDLLPVSANATPVDLGAGFTPLVRAHRLAEQLGIDELYLKNDTANPTHSFKDRVVSVALTVAREMGFKTVACASTGNLANAVAAHAAHAGLESYVFIPADLERGKVVTTAIYGGNLVAVKGNYDEVNRLCSEIAQSFDWAFVNVNIRPFYSEGSKTLAFEITEQLGWKAPAHVVVPVASGSLLTKILRGLDELEWTGLIDGHETAIHAAQAKGCSPVVTALEAGIGHVKPVKPNTIAKSLAIGNPADGHYAVEAVRRTGGSGADVTDEEIVDGIRLLATTEGIFTETAGGVTVGVLKKLAERGAFASGGPVVALITGMGLKTAEVLGDSMGPTFEIPPNMEDFQEELKLQ
ncbi:MAG TPA: threonine synthase [Actinomycetota bacterium]|nr:threonine synthase [Actinomycetota bacterium]